MSDITERWEACIQVFEAAVDRQDVAAAEQALLDALSLVESSEGHTLQHAQTLVNLAMVADLREDYPKTKQLAGASLAIMQQLDEEVPDLKAAALDFLSKCAFEDREYDKAETLSRQALAIMETNLEEGDQTPFVTAFRIACCCLEQERMDAAAKAYTQALSIADRIMADDEPEIGYVLDHYADLLEVLGRNEEATEFRKRANKIWEKHPHLKPKDTNWFLASPWYVKGTLVSMAITVTFYVATILVDGLFLPAIISAIVSLIFLLLFGRLCPRDLTRWEKGDAE